MLLICSSPLIHVTVLSSNGTNLAPSVPILHSYIPRSTLQQRTYISRPARQCFPGDDWISRSQCDREVSPQKFTTTCQEPLKEDSSYRNIHDSEGRCTPNEICVGGGLKRWEAESSPPLQASCVTTDHFSPIGHAPSGSGQVSTGVVTADFHPASRNANLAVEAVITSVDNRTSVFATSIVVQAQRFEGAWRTVDNGTAECLRCSSVVLAPFPMTVSRVKVDVVMPDSTPMGLLWLASYDDQQY